MLITPTQLGAAILTARRPLRIIKAADQRYTLGLAYPAGRIDKHGEGMTPAELERTAWEYLRKAEVGLYHADGTTGHARPVESYIWRAPDWRLVDASGHEQVIKAGDWLLGAVWDEPAWALIKAGKVTGWSIDGFGKRRTVPRSAIETAT